MSFKTGHRLFLHMNRAYITNISFENDFSCAAVRITDNVQT